MKVKKADVFIHTGLDLEAWRDPLLNVAGKTSLMWPNGERQIDTSKGIPLLEIPSSLSRAQGDIHAYGNPHYWLSPDNGKIIARNIAEGLARLYPEDSSFFQSNEKAFELKIDEKMGEWSHELMPFKGEKAVSYHKSWPYFAKQFGLVLIGELEPKPGIPPTAKHLAQLENAMREQHAKVILKETFFEHKTPDTVAKETGAVVATLAQSVGDVKGATDYLHMVDYNVRQVVEAFEKAGAPHA